MKSLSPVFIFFARLIFGGSLMLFSLLLLASLFNYKFNGPTSYALVTDSAIANSLINFEFQISRILIALLGIASFSVPIVLIFISYKATFKKNYKFRKKMILYIFLMISSLSFTISILFSHQDSTIHGITGNAYSSALSNITDPRAIQSIHCLSIATLIFTSNSLLELAIKEKIFLVFRIIYIAFSKVFNITKFLILTSINALLLQIKNILYCLLNSIALIAKKIKNIKLMKLTSNATKDNSEEIYLDISDIDNVELLKNIEINNSIENKEPNKYKQPTPKKKYKTSKRQYKIKHLFFEEPENSEQIIDDKFYAQQSELLESILKNFGVCGEIIGYQVGPVVTLYEFEPEAGVKSSRVIGLSDDIARTMKVVSTRITTMHGKSALGIEIPNEKREKFNIKSIIEYEKFDDAILPLAIGKDISGEPVIADLYKMPHLLIAGTTGSGKSVSINAMILSLLAKHSPKTCKMIMVDPKMLELSLYNDIPHLITPVVTDPKRAINVLQYVVKEMEARYQTISMLGMRNICKYNEKIREGLKNNENLEKRLQTGFDKETGNPIFETISIKMEEMPFIVVIVDEIADLMLVSGKEVEMAIQRLSQMARAAGIHLILSTQRPSVDVITGVIKANLPTRISFSVSSKIDSRTIIGEQGAEQLLRMGDMLYMHEGNKLTRVHGAFVDDTEVHEIVQYLKENFPPPEYIENAKIVDSTDKFNNDKQGIDSDDSNINSNDTMYKQVLEMLESGEKISISYIQRKLRIGYNRSANIIEKLEEDGIVGPPNKSGKREILKKTTK